MFPVPLAANPIALLEFVQAKVPPAGVLTKLVPGMDPPLQMVMLDGTETVGTGFTVMV